MAPRLSSAVRVLPALAAVLAITLFWPGTGPAAATGVNSITSPDTAGIVGYYTSLALDSTGNPVVSYWDATEFDLRVMHCNDPSCAGGDESITSPDTGGDVGRSTSLALDASGFPVVSYRDETNMDLKVLHCGDANCTGGNSITSPDTGGDVGYYTSLALDGSGYPVVSYFDQTNWDLKVLHCGNANCTAGNSITSPDTGGNVGRYTSLALDASGYPVVSYLDDINYDLKVLHCGDANCTAGNSITSPDTGGNVGLYTSLALDASGYPVVSYSDWDPNYDLKMMHCNDANCSGGDENIASPDTGGSVGVDTSLALDSSGYPVVSYWDSTNGDLKMMHCDDVNCSGGDENITSPDTGGIVGSDTSLALDASGNPVVSYFDGSNGNLKLLHCGDADCSPGNSITSPDTGNVANYPDTSLALDSSGYPVVSYRHWDGSEHDLNVLHCGDANCAAGNSIASPDTGGDVGLWSSLVLDASGNPVVSYYDRTNLDLKVLHCGNANCTSGNSITSPDTGGYDGSHTSLALDASGYPVVSYYDSLNTNLKVLHCGNANCTAGNTITSPDTTLDVNVGEYTSLALDASGYPVVSYHDSTNADLKVLHCGNANCTAGNSITSPDTGGAVGWYTSLALDASGYPVVSYRDQTNNDLKVLHCGNANCTSGNSMASPDTGGYFGGMNSLALDSSGYPVVSYTGWDLLEADLEVLHCGDANCTSGNSVTSPDTAGDVGTHNSLALDSSGNPVVSYFDNTNDDLKVLHCGDATCGAPQTFTVDSTADVVDASPGDGNCDDGAGNCTLRAAIQEANAYKGPDIIDLPAGTYTLTIAGTGEDAAATGDLDITDDLIIAGVGPGTIVDGGALDTVFHILSGNTVEINNATITNGLGPGGGGAGGIYNFGTLFLLSSQIIGNATNTSGGGIFQHQAVALIVNSTISYNGAAVCCGGIESSSSNLSLINSTVSGNQANDYAGGIHQVGVSSHLDLLNTTVTSNISDADTSGGGAGGGIVISLGTSNILNSIISGNVDNTGVAPDCSGTLTSAGYNLIGNDTGCAFSATTGDQVGTGASPIDALLGTLRDNGGLTLTHLVPVVSPAVDAGSPAMPGGGGDACEATDQRGEARALDGDGDGVARCDVGAYETEGAKTVDCPNPPDVPPPAASCDPITFDASLDIDLGIGLLAVLIEDCSGTGHLTAARDAVGDNVPNGLDDMPIEITFLSGFVDCPGPLALGSSIPSTGLIEEQKNNDPGELEFPADGEFTLCLEADTYPFGVLNNCPDDFELGNKEPLNLSCKIYSPVSFDCTLVGQSGFFNGAGVEMATVQSGTMDMARLGDSDGDGCADVEESGVNEALGGQRDHWYFWDFYDVWTHPIGDPDGWERSKGIDLFGDIFEVAFRFGAHDSGPGSFDRDSDPLSTPNPVTGNSREDYHPAFDRGAQTGPNDWDLAPADGSIDLFNDIFGVAYQFGHDCTAAP